MSDEKKQMYQKGMQTAKKVVLCGCFILTFFLFPLPLFAEEYGWDIRLNNYTHETLRENGRPFFKDTEFSYIQTLLVQAEEGLKATEFDFTNVKGEIVCHVTVKTRGLKSSAMLLSADPKPGKTCKVDYKTGPYRVPMIERPNETQHHLPQITISILDASEGYEEGVIVRSLYCVPDDIKTLASNIDRISHIKQVGRTDYYRITLKNGTNAGYETLETNSWNRCMRTEQYWFIVRDPQDYFVSTIPPDWRLKGNLSGTQRLRLEKREAGAMNFDAAITVQLLPFDVKSQDDPMTREDGLYTVRTKYGIFLVKYEATKERFSSEIDKFHLFIEALTFNDIDLQKQ